MDYSVQSNEQIAASINTYLNNDWKCSTTESHPHYTTLEKRTKRNDITLLRCCNLIRKDPCAFQTHNISKMRNHLLTKVHQVRAISVGVPEESLLKKQLKKRGIEFLYRVIIN